MIKQLLPKGVGNLVAIEGTAGHAQTIAFNEAFAEDFAGTQIDPGRKQRGLSTKIRTKIRGSGSADLDEHDELF